MDLITLMLAGLLLAAAAARAKPRATEAAGKDEPGEPGSAPPKEPRGQAE